MRGIEATVMKLHTSAAQEELQKPAPETQGHSRTDLEEVIQTRNAREQALSREFENDKDRNRFGAEGPQEVLDPSTDGDHT